MQRWNIHIYSMASKDNLTKNYNYDGNARTSMMYSWRTGSFLLGSMWSGSSNSSIPSESSFSRWSGVQFLSFLLYTATQQDTFLLMLYHSVYYKTRDSKEEWTPVVRKRRKGRRHVMSVEAPKVIVIEAKWMYLAQGWWGTRCVMKHLDWLFSAEDLLLGYQSKLWLWNLKSQLLPERDLNLILKSSRALPLN